MDKCTEIWRDVQGYEGLYQISNLGRVRSVPRYALGHNGVKEFVHGKVKKQADNGHGYRKVNLWKNNKGKDFYVHRLVGTAFIPNPEGLPTIDHVDGNKLNNCVSNLEWVTYSENNKRAFKNGQKPLTRYTKAKNKKSVKCVDLKTHKVMIFVSMREAERQLKIANGGVSHSIKYNQLCNGMKWEIIK